MMPKFDVLEAIAWRKESGSEVGFDVIAGKQQLRFIRKFSPKNVRCRVDGRKRRLSKTLSDLQGRAFQDGGIAIASRGLKSSKTICSTNAQYHKAAGFYEFEHKSLEA